MTTVTWTWVVGAFLVGGTLGYILASIMAMGSDR